MVLFDEDFTGIFDDAQLSNWTLQGEELISNPSYSSTGTSYNSSQMWGDTQGYMSLSLDNDNWQRASAFYTAETIRTDYWTLSASIKVDGPSSVTPTDPGREHAGLAFVWINANTIDLDDGEEELLGGWGEYAGAPRGTEVVAGDVGYYSGLKAHAVILDEQFLDEAIQEEQRMQNLETWSEVSGSSQDFSTDDDFFYNDGWLDVRLENYRGQFTFYWGDDYTNSYTWTDNNYQGVGHGYFGFSAATDSFSAGHHLDNVTLTYPEPGTLLLILPGAALLYLRRRREE
jgi:hypothetical protein